MRWIEPQLKEIGVVDGDLTSNLVPMTSGREEKLWSNPKMAIFDCLLKKRFISCHLKIIDDLSVLE